MSITTNNTIAKIAATVAGIGLVALAFAPFAKADTTTDLQSQINALLAEIASLQSQLGQSGGTTTTAAFTRDLTIGATGADVTQLQTWLISQGYSIPAGATGYFGAQTQAAVAAYQAANGISPAAGYFGPITRAAVNAKLATSVSTTGTGTGTGNGNGNQLSGGEATLSDYQLITGNTVGEGDTGDTLGTAKFDVKGGDVNVGRVRVEFQKSSSSISASNDPWLYFQKLYVYDGSTKVGSVDVSQRSDWNDSADDGNHGGSGDVFSIDIPVNDIVKQGDTAMLNIEADAQNTIDSDNTDQVFFMDIPDQGIRVTDAAGIQDYVGGTSDTVDVDFNGSTAGKLTVTEDTDDPQAGVLVADANQSTDNLTVFKFDIRNTEDSDSLLDNVKIEIATSSPSGSPAKNITSIVTRATLQSSTGQDYDGTITGGPNAINFDLTNDNEIVKANDTNTYTLVIGLASQSGHYAASGEALTASIVSSSNDVTAEGVQNGQSTTVSGTANGNQQSIALNGGISATGGTNTGVDQNVGGSTANNVGIFALNLNITAIGDDVYIPRTMQAIASTTVPGANTGIVVFTDYIGSTTNSTITSSLTSTADVDNANYYVVHAGQTETFTANLTIDPSGTEFLEPAVDRIRFNTEDADFTGLQTLDVDQTDSQFETPTTNVFYP